MKLYSNADIMPVLVETETDKCARLLIRDKTTEELVEDASFVCENTKNFDVFSINKDNVNEQ